MSWTIQIGDLEIHSQNYSELKLSDLDAEWKRQILGFVQEWYSENEQIELRTSGSTGDPKLIKYPKSRMIASAERTIQFFDLKPDQTALICLPAGFIAGKMMILRAMLGGLKLKALEASSRPLSEMESEIDFVAMTPMQVERSLSEDLDHFKYIKSLIIGGAPLNAKLEKELIKLRPDVYESYGMTETCSHVALRAIGEEDFQAMDGVSFETDSEDRLIIDDQALKLEGLKTNDIVKIKSEKQFIWQGRSDWVINSGGIKLQPELIEKKLSSVISAPLFVCGLEDPKLGEAAVVIYEADREIPEELIKQAEASLDKYERPKKYIRLDRFVRLGNGKLDRKASKTLLGI